MINTGRQSRKERIENTLLENNLKADKQILYVILYLVFIEFNHPAHRTVNVNRDS